MLQLRAFSPPDQAAAIAEHLNSLPGVHHLVIHGSTASGLVMLTGDIDPDEADIVLDALRQYGLAADDVALWRVTSVQPLGWRRRRPAAGRDATVWAEVVGRAHDHARLALTYVLYMAAAGVVAGVGVLTASPILVVGAMALSPDLLPISASAVGFVQRRWPLVARAEATLVLGMGVVVLFAAASTAVLRLTGRIDASLDLVSTTLGPSLTDVGPGTVLVALAAGMAGMLAYETAGSAAVGVAISVTTIPAAAYLGDAIALGPSQDGVGALTVLLTNIVILETACAVTLWAQQRHRRSAVPDPSVPEQT